MKNILLTVTALAALSGSALAQTWSTTGAKDGFTTHSGEYLSPTTVKAIEIASPKNKVWVFAKSNNSEAVDVQLINSAGLVVSTYSITATSATALVSVTLPAPQFAARIKVSPTAMTGSDSVSATVIQGPDNKY